MHGNLGVEHKMLCVKSDQPIQNCCGTTLMHPAATRSIRIPDEKDPTKAARNILAQYADLIEERQNLIKKSDPSGREADLRTGWFLWQESLSEFLYFEERMEAPVPKKYWAEWRESGGGSRKASKNLWVYEEATGKKRFSITTQAGPKIQPYFDVPAPNDPALHKFIVQGELQPSGMVRVWLTRSTALFLNRILGSMSPEAIEEAIKKIQIPAQSGEVERIEPAIPVLISSSTYALLSSKVNGISDEHRFQLLVHSLLEGNSK
ncbi:MAG: hypothetical protein ACLGGX_12700 [Bdellovibrionia bacterium]